MVITQAVAVVAYSPAAQLAPEVQAAVEMVVTKAQALLLQLLELQIQAQAAVVVLLNLPQAATAVVEL